jgi:hypothetical protein
MRETTPLLSLDLLERVHTYDGVARALGVDREAARRAVRDALESVVAGRQPAPPEAVRAQIVDYLLGEQTLPERMQTREALDRAPLDRAWAIEARLSLSLVMHAPLPLIPDPETDLATGLPRRRDRPAQLDPADPSDERRDRPPALALAGARAGRQGKVLPRRVYLVRRATALAVLAAVIVAAVTIATGAGSSGARHRATSAQATLQHLTLTPTSAQPSATGLGAIVRQRGSLLLLLQGRHITPNHGNYYAVWLFNAEGDAELLGLVTPPVGSRRTFSSGATLPDDAVRFHRLVVTSETNATPSRPGPQILSSPLSVQ